jgi:hypothetical protein
MSARIIAGLLERFALAGQRWRTTAGYCDNTAIGPMVPEWLLPIGERREPLADALDNPNSLTWVRLTRHVLLHQAADNDSPCLQAADIRGTAIAFNLASGTATILSNRRLLGTRDVRQMYVASDRDVSLVVSEFETLCATVPRTH